MYKFSLSFFFKKYAKKTLPDVELSETEALATADTQQVVGGRRGKLGFLKFRGKTRNGSPNSSILNRLTGKRLG
ncbi:MAG: hypothetical protein RL757_1622 [Bacteroidota bacterium]|jgi:hypothetical protein